MRIEKNSQFKKIECCVGVSLLEKGIALYNKIYSLLIYERQMLLTLLMKETNLQYLLFVYY